MPWYEIIYEPGTHSIAKYDDDAEALDAISAQHERAVSGERGGPSGHSAERVARVFKYDEHPVDYNLANTTSIADLTAGLTDLLKRKADDQGGDVSFIQADQAVGELASPVLFNRDKPHDSKYKMKEVSELEAATWQ